MTKKKIRASAEAWESGELGTDPSSVRVADVDPAAVDDSAGLIQISIRFQKSLIEDFKRIAETQGIGYQPLMRQVLTQYINEHGTDLDLGLEASLDFGTLKVEYPNPRKKRGYA